jgi:hypothetical protein
VVPLDLIESSFADRPMLMFTSALFSEFIVSVYSKGMARFVALMFTIFCGGVGFATALVIGPLSECEVGSEMFTFYLDRLADFHWFSPPLPNNDIIERFTRADQETEYSWRTH